MLFSQVMKDKEQTGFFTTKHVHLQTDPTGLISFAKTVCGRSQEHSTWVSKDKMYKVTCEQCREQQA